MVDLNDVELGRYDGYGPAPFPDPRDAELDAYVAGLDGGSQEPSEQVRRVLRAYAERAAARAVRDQRPDLLVMACVGVVAGGLATLEREALMAMPLIGDASRRLGIELGDVFEQAAASLSPAAAGNLRSWLSRPAADRTLESMGFAAVEDEDGFRYRWTDVPWQPVRPAPPAPEAPQPSRLQRFLRWWNATKGFGPGDGGPA